MQRKSQTILFLVTMLALAGCANREAGQKGRMEPTAPAPADRPIVIGTAAPLSGDQAQIGQDMVRGVELAIDEINANGGLLGRRVRVEALDDRADPREATTVASKLVADQRVAGVVGHLNSGCSIPASAVYHRAHMVMITPVSTADKLTAQGFPEVFRVVLRNSDQGPAAARYAREKLGAATVATVDDRSAYGRGIVAAFLQEAERLGLRVVARESFGVGDKDFSAVVTRLKAAAPDVVYAGCMFTEGALLIKQARARGVKARFMSGDGFFAPRLMALGGPAVEGTIVSFLAPPWDTTPAAEAFLEAYRRRYHEQVKTYAPLAYDATMILAEAVRKAQTADRATVVRVLHDPAFTWKGIGGTYRFDANGDIRDPHPYFYEVRNGKFVVLDGTEGDVRR